MMNRICDTNFFYNAAKKPTHAQGIANGARLFISPISIIEIISKTDNFEERKAAAEWVLNNGIRPLPFLESPISTAWGVKVAVISNNYLIEILKVMVNASSPLDFGNGVIDLARNYPCKVDILAEHHNRVNLYKCFETEMLDSFEKFLEIIFPGYKKRISKKFKPIGNKKFRNEIYKKLSHSDFEQEILRITHTHAQHFNPGIEIDDFGSQSKNAMNYLSAYVHIYLEYYKRGVMGEFKVRENDFGDLQLFFYLRDGWQVVTSDIRWIKLAKSANMRNMIYEPNWI